MANPPLPKFKYHPDPLTSGSIETSDNTCACCKQRRGYIYVGPCFGEDDYSQKICPWCIADGNARKKLVVSFHDEAAVPGEDFPDAPAVSEAVIAELCHRTPGFIGWQQEQWFTCCDDAAAFLGRAGHLELANRYEGALAALRATATLEDDDEWEELLDSLDPNGSPTAYVFRCLHCGQYGAYHDAD